MIRKVTIVACSLLAVTHLVSAATNKPQVLLNETEIRILLVTNQNVSQQAIDNAKDYLTNSWTNTGLHNGTTTGTTITFANQGIPVESPLSDLVFAGGVIEQQSKLKLFAEAIFPPSAISLRDLHSADIVLGLSPSATDACGWAPQGGTG